MRLCLYVVLSFWMGNTAAEDEVSSSSNRVTVTLPSAPGPLGNPLKGWCQYPNLATHSQSASMVFHYAAWKTLEPVEGEYTFDQWESDTWNQPEHLDKHVVMRVFIDYPKRESGLPEWLVAKGVPQQGYRDYGGGLSPDYDHPAMLAGMKRFIAALGKRYNDHPRVAFIQLGMLGHWGEWHTYPRNELFASVDTQREIIDAYHQAFPDKHLMARTADDYAGTLPWIGYHDDLFPDDTDNGHEWSFLAKIRAANRDLNWQVAPIGGEMVPGEARKWLTDEFATTMRMIDRSHFTWVGPYGPAHEESKKYEKQLSDAFNANTESMIRRLGYEFRLTHLRHPPEIRLRDLNAAEPVRIDVRGENQGVAPFYYPWPVRFAMINDQGQPACIGTTTCDVRRWQPGTPFVENCMVPFNAIHAKDPIAPGIYRLAIGIIDPWKKIPRVEFANDLSVVDGWTVLSEIRVKD